MIVGRMVGRIVLLSLACISQGSAQIAGELDLFLLTRTLRAEVDAARAAAEPDSQTIRKALAALKNPRAQNGKLEMLRAIVDLRRGKWSDTLAAALDYRMSAGESVVAPRAVCHLAIEGAAPAASAHALEAQVSLQDDKGGIVVPGKSRPITDMTDREIPLQAPPAEGKYSILFEIKDAKSGEIVAQSRATLWVVDRLRQRLRDMADRAGALALKPSSAASTIWLNSVLALVDRYSIASRQSLGMPVQLASAVVQTVAPLPGLEPFDPLRDLSWAESALDVIAQGKPFSATPGAWMPFAVRSRRDQTLRLARIWWPESKPAGLVLLLGDTLSHERSWSDVSLPGGFIGLAPSVRLDSQGATPPGWEDFEDWRSGLEVLTGADLKPAFLVMHGNGARQGLDLASEQPSRFRGLAILAGTSDRALATVPKDFPPLLLAEGAKDRFVLAGDLRRAGLFFQSRLQTFEYVVLPDAGHYDLRTAAAPKVMEFFAAIAAGTWKPSGQRVPLPDARAQ